MRILSNTLLMTKKILTMLLLLMKVKGQRGTESVSGTEELWRLMT